MKLGDYGLARSMREINTMAARLARMAVTEACCSHVCLVCGTLGPTGLLPSSASSGRKKSCFDEIATVFGQQAAALIDGGADLLLLETMQDLLEMRAAVVGIRRMLDERSRAIPLQVHITVDTAGHMLFGSDIMAFCAAAQLPIDALGLNCSTGPHEMKPFVHDLFAAFTASRFHDAQCGHARKRRRNCRLQNGSAGIC